MDIGKAETPEDEREISLNETSLKKPLDVLDVIGGHGPWQFRQWIVFFTASLCNAAVLFSALFLPSQTYCFSENSTGIYKEHPSIAESHNATLLPEARGYIMENGTVEKDTDCHSLECKINTSRISLDVSTSKVFSDAECWNSQIEIFAKCSYVVACLLSGIMVYFCTGRFGRRPLALVSCLFLVASSLGASWAGTAAIFLILRFITSFGIFNIYLISAFSLMEYVHKDFKLLYFFTGHLGWGMSHFLLPAVAWLAEDWTMFNVIVSIICIVLSVFLWCSPESPSSFPQGGESTRTRKVLKYAAFINGYSTTDVDLLTHNFRQRQDSKHDLGTLASPKTKIFCFVYSSFLFFLSFTTAFLYFATKWHPEWFKIDSRRVSFSFLGTTEVASAIILLFLACIVPIKYLWACVAAMTSALLMVVFSRTKGGSSTSSAILYTVIVFFASASWTLLLAKTFCHKISNTVAKCNLGVTAIAVFSGALGASAVVLNAHNQVLLLALAIPHLLFAILTLFLPDYYFGMIS